jgi:uncharacterized protein YukE
MTTIHMETEKVHLLARQLDSHGSQMLSTLSQMQSAASGLHFAWQGGPADDFHQDLRQILKKLENQATALQFLSVRLSREVDEWVSKDRFDQMGGGGHGMFKGKLLPFDIGAIGLGGASAVLMEQKMQAPSWLEQHFSVDAGAGYGGSYLSKTGKQQWHHSKPKFGVEAKASIGDSISESEHYSWGKWEVGAKVGADKKGVDAGLYAEASVFEAHESKVFGSSMFGFTTTGAVAAGTLEGFAGMKDNSVGASVGGSVASLDLGVGLNLFGYNIGLSGGAGLGLQAGFKIGAKTEAKLGPFKLGVSIGKAVTEE